MHTNFFLPSRGRMGSNYVREAAASIVKRQRVATRRN